MEFVTSAQRANGIVVMLFRNKGGASDTKAQKAAAAAKPVAKKTGPPPRTPWGDPDLQGIWNDATSTPLQRPSELAGKDVLSDEEAEDFQQQTAEGLSRDRRDGGRDADVNRAYNEHWMDARRLKITAELYLRSSGCDQRPCTTASAQPRTTSMSLP